MIPPEIIIRPVESWPVWYLRSELRSREPLFYTELDGRYYRIRTAQLDPDEARPGKIYVLDIERYTYEANLKEWHWWTIHYTRRLTYPEMQATRTEFQEQLVRYAVASVL